MSPLPKKKKTREELAALRDSLGISSEGPPPGAPGTMGQAPMARAEAPVVEPAREATPLPEVNAEPKKRVAPQEESEEVEKIEAEDSPMREKAVVLETEKVSSTEAKPVRSLRKSAGLSVDKPKEVISKDSGKLPTRRHRDGERVPLEKPSKSLSLAGGNLPTRKHSDQELAKLRHVALPGVEDPAMHHVKKTATLPVLIGVYGLGLILMLLAVLGAISVRAPSFDLPFDWLRSAVALPNITIILYSLMTGGVVVMLLGAGWIFFKKPISQHHSAILTIIAMLVLVFGTLYFFPELHGA